LSFRARNFYRASRAVGLLAGTASDSVAALFCGQEIGSNCRTREVGAPFPIQEEIRFEPFTIPGLRMRRRALTLLLHEDRLFQTAQLGEVAELLQHHCRQDCAGRDDKYAIGCFNVFV